MPTSDREAVRGADVVLSLTTAAFALAAAASVAGELAGDTLYADLNTSAPAAQAGARGGAAGAVRRRRADRRRPELGLATPALASGAGAERFAELFRPLGMPVEVVGTAARATRPG